MINTEELCMNCMKEIGKLKQCPHCGFLADTPQLAPYLPVRAVLGNRYLVGKVLDYNGEGATYAGWDLMNRLPVSIREFLPDSVATRTQNELTIRIMAGSEQTFSECCQSFFEMWRQLARLRGLSALISVVDIIEDNGTAYAISEHFDGVTLRDFLLKSKTGYITWERARQLFMPVLSTLGTLHTSGIIHRGLSPTNLLIGQDGKIRITGFCIWQARTAGSELMPQLFNGYSPIEQYGQKGQQGPWTDIYAFMAVLYRALIGSDPLDAPSRLQNDKLMIPGKFAEQIPAYVINAMINSLQILPDDRTKTVDRLRAELSASPSVTANTEKTELPPVTPDPAAVATAKSFGLRNMTKQNKMLILKTGAISLGAGLLVFLILAATVWRNDFFGPGKPGITDSQETTLGEQIEVPKFSEIGTYLEISTNAMWLERFTFTAEEVFDAKVPVGVIISQSVEPGTTVAKGSSIMLKVSKGKEMVDLPAAVVGMEYEAANTLLTGLGFTVEKRDETNDGTKAANIVMAASPAVGQQYEKGTKVTLRVWAEMATTTSPAATTTKSAASTTKPASTAPPATTAPTTAAPATTQPTTAETTTEMEP